MLISRKWPAMTAARRAYSSPSPTDDLVPILRRLRKTLKSDYIVAATIAADAQTAIIGSIGAYHADMADGLERMLEHRHECDAYPQRELSPILGKGPVAAPQIASILAAETGSSVLTMRLPAGPHPTIAIIAARCAPRAPFNAGDERAFQRHADWIADHFAMWWRLHEAEKRRAGLERALDQVGLAIIRLDRDGRTVGANAAARSLLTAADGLIAVGETLSAVELDDAVRLHSAIGHALVGPFRDARAPVLTVRRKRRRPLVIAVLRVAAEPQAGETAIVLQVVEPDRDHDSAITAACTLLGLTGAEARLAKLLVGGATLAEAAAALRIQIPTARTYLKQAFAKSGTNRQAALVQVLMSSLIHASAGTVLTAV